MIKDLTKQYDEIGVAYLEGQKKFYNGKIDAPRKFILNNLKFNETTSLLDVGCGNGDDILLYRNRGVKIVCGVDSSKVMVQEAKRKLLDTSGDIALVNIEDAAYQDNAFNAVVARYSLQNLANLDKAYENIARILNPNGQFVFTVPHPIRDFALSKEKRYGKQEIVQISLYNRSVVVNLPTHTLKDYLSDIFCEKFTLETIHEEVRESDEDAHIEGMPEFLGISARKR